MAEYDWDWDQMYKEYRSFLEFRGVKQIKCFDCAKQTMLSELRAYCGLFLCLSCLKKRTEPSDMTVNQLLGINGGEREDG